MDVDQVQECLLIVEIFLEEAEVEPEEAKVEPEEAEVEPEEAKAESEEAGVVKAKVEPEEAEVDRVKQNPVENKHNKIMLRSGMQRIPLCVLR